MTERPTLSVIIPAGDRSRSANLEALLADVRAQTWPPDEIEIVCGVQPNGRARNVGLERTSGEIVIFLDDDVRLGNPDLFQRFAECLVAEPDLGMVGSAQLLPPNSSRFQRRCARQIPRSECAVVDRLTESDMVTTQCCAMRRSVLLGVGGFHDRILRGVDPELRHRLRQRGYRIAIVPHTWHYHPMPATLGALLRMAWRNGVSSAFARRFYPQAVLITPEGHVAEFEAQPSLPRRVARQAWGWVRDLLTGRWYGLIFRTVYLAANLWGAWRWRQPDRPRRTAREV